MIAACVAIGITLVTLFTGRDQPRHEGRPLSDWLQDFALVNSDSSPLGQQVNAAVRAMGTNAIPSLLDIIIHGTPPSFFREALGWLLRGFPPSVRDNVPLLGGWVYGNPDESLRQTVPFAFDALGPAAAPAIPHLERMIQENVNDAVYWNALYSLAAISTNAQSILLAELEGPNHSRQIMAARAFSTFYLQRANAAPSLPLLLDILHKSDSSQVRVAAIMTLTRIEVTPELVVPDLIKALNDPDPTVRQSMTNALQKLAPEVFTNPLPQ